jgi:hypothetical protein
MRLSACGWPIGEWAKARDLTAAIWTALKPGFPRHKGRPLTCRQAIDYLSSLEGSDRLRAEEYVRRAPIQVNTPYRAAIELELG